MTTSYLSCQSGPGNRIHILPFDHHIDRGIPKVVGLLYATAIAMRYDSVDSDVSLGTLGGCGCVFDSPFGPFEHVIIVKNQDALLICLSSRN